MSTTRVRVDPGNPASLPRGRVDHSVLDGATEADLVAQQHQDDAEAVRDVVRFARRVRQCLGLTKVEFARRIEGI